MKIFSWFVPASLVTLGFCFLPGCGYDGPETSPCESFSRSESDLCASRRDERDWIQNLTVNSVFQGTEKINVPPYIHFNDNRTHQITGDAGLAKVIDPTNACCTTLSSIDRYATTPRLRWSSAGLNLVAAAIFKKPVDFFPNKMSIKNTGDVVWTWNSSMGTGAESGGYTFVEYIDGKMVDESQISNRELEPLVPGTMYFWCVWAWDSNGRIIEKSSSVIPFVVGEFTTRYNITGLAKTWVLKKATRDSDLADVTSAIPIESITFDNDCVGAVVLSAGQSNEWKLTTKGAFEFKDDIGLSDVKIEWLCSSLILLSAKLDGQTIRLSLE